MSGGQVLADLRSTIARLSSLVDEVSADLREGRPPGVPSAPFEVRDTIGTRAHRIPVKLDPSVPPGEIRLQAGDTVQTFAQGDIRVDFASGWSRVVAATDAAWVAIRDATGRPPWDTHTTSPNHAMAELARHYISLHQAVLEIARNCLGMEGNETLLLTTMADRIDELRKQTRIVEGLSVDQAVAALDSIKDGLTRVDIEHSLIVLEALRGTLSPAPPAQDPG